MAMNSEQQFSVLGDGSSASSNVTVALQKIWQFCVPKGSFRVNQSTGNKSQSSVGDASEMEMAAIRQRKALYKLRSYVTKFDRWVQAEFNESRHMEDIPPEQLDAYLAQFFTTLKTDRGGEYGYDSLITLRSGLEQYLRQKGYPHLIRSSPLFCHSQAAVRKRRLKQAHARHQQAEISNNHNEH